MTAGGDPPAVPNPPRTPDHIREAVADDIRAYAGKDPRGSVRAIALRHGISKTTVGRIADEHDLASAWDENTSQTAQATETRRAYIARQRALAQEDLWDRVGTLLDRFDDEVTHLNVVKCIPHDIGDEDGGEGLLAVERVEHTVLPPGPQEWRSTSTAIAALSRAAIDIAKLDNDTSATNSTVGLLDQFADDLKAERAAREARSPSEPE